ncbi:MAG: hypothetical protein ABWY52_04325, partial [Candidatus Limnocylindrales bacterium]
MATLSLYLFVAGGLALAFAFACHVAYSTILAQSGVAVARRAMTPAGAAVGVGGGSTTVAIGGSGRGMGDRSDQGAMPGVTSGAFAISATWVAAAVIGCSMILRA